MATRQAAESSQSSAGQALHHLQPDATQLFALLAGYLYLTGYLITAITLRNYGIHRFEAVKLQYVETGIAFTVLAISFTLIPLTASYAYHRVRSVSGLPHFKTGLVGYVINFSIFFFLLTFFAMFVTVFEWTARTSLGSFHSISIQALFYIYAAIAVFVIAFLPLVERKLVSSSTVRLRLYYWILVEPLRYGSVLLAIALIVVLARSIPWFTRWMTDLIPFVLTLVSMIAASWGIAFWIRKVGRARNVYALGILSLIGMLTLFYFSINAYVYGVIRYLPSNRGGKLPVTMSYLTTDAAVMRDLPIPRANGRGPNTWGPVYILEVGSDEVHVAATDTGDWVDGWVPITTINKAEIDYIHSIRITSGIPRNTVQRNNESQESSDGTVVK